MRPIPGGKLTATRLTFGVAVKVARLAEVNLSKGLGRRHTRDPETAARAARGGAIAEGRQGDDLSVRRSRGQGDRGHDGGREEDLAHETPPFRRVQGALWCVA